MDNITKSSHFFELLPPELRVVFNISLTMNQPKFIEYTNAMNPTIIQQSQIEKNDRLFVYLPMALMYKNDAMTTFIYNIMQLSGYQMKEEDFKMQVEKINNQVLSKVIDNQFGGGKLTDYLYGIGIIIFAIFYDYYIITNGSWDRLHSSISQINELSSRIQSGCTMEYRPSKTISLLARGTKDPSFIYGLEHTMQCLSTPTLLSSKLHDLDVEKDSSILLNEMQQKFKELPGFPELPKPTEIGTQLVPFGENPEEIHDFLNTRLLVLKEDSSYDIDLDKTIHHFKLLADMSTDEFKKAFEFQKEQSTPIPSPTQAPTMEYTLSFASDLIGAFKELAPTNFSPSFSFQNVFLWALKDTIRDTIRKIEDGKIKSKRDIENLITEGTRVFSDISNLPYIISFLFFLNLTAMRSFIFFAKKMMGTKPKLLQIKDSNQVEEITEGGYIRKKNKTTRKRKTRKHNKRKQSKSKKNRRITRKR